MRSRLTVVDTVFWQGPDGQPTAAETRFGRWLESGKAPHVRSLQVGERWQPIDPGHLRAASAVVVANDGGEVPSVNLTPEQEREAAEKVLEFGSWQMQDVQPFVFAPIPPGESARLPDPPLSQLAIRCRKGQTRCTVYLFPA